MSKPTTQVRVTRRQVELAQTKVEADRALDRRPDPLLERIAGAVEERATRLQAR